MPKQKVSEKFLIRQSLKVFRSKGYADTSMEDIATACGIKKGSLYHYFKGGKKDILKAVINHVHEYYKTEIFIHAYDKQLGGKQKLQLLANIAENQFFTTDSGCLMGNLALETAGNMLDFSKMVQLFFQDWIDAMTHIFKEKYDVQTAQILAKNCVAQIEGAVMMMRLFNDTNFLTYTHQNIIQLLD